MRHVLTIILMVLVMVGCSSENPLCTSSFCVEGEIYPRSELAEGQAYDTWDVDESVLFGVLGGTTPIEPTPIQATPADEPDYTLMDIIQDVGAGNETYLNQTVTVTGFVVWKHANGNSIVIYETADINESGRESAAFFINVAHKTELLEPYEVGTSYTFTVEIRIIRQPQKAGHPIGIFAYFPEDTE